MSIWSGRWMPRLAREHGMIEPFVDTQFRRGVISYADKKGKHQGQRDMTLPRL